MSADRARLRLAGLGATALLAGGACAAGALPFTDPAVGVRVEGLFASSGRYLVGLVLWVFGLALLTWVWWRLRDTLDTRWLLVTGALAALPLLIAPPLGSRDVYAYACQGSLFLDGVDPYGHGAAAGCPWAASVPEVWRDAPAPYGPLGIVTSALAVALARLFPDNAQLPAAVAGLRLVALAGVLLLAWGTTRLARAIGVDPTPAAWLGVVTPLVALHAVSGAHNDALVAGLTLTGLAISARPVLRHVLVNAALAGTLLSLAAAVKVTAVVAFPFALLLSTARRAAPPARPGPANTTPAAGTARTNARIWATFLGGAVVAFAALSAATGLGFGWVGALARSSSLAQWTSPPTGLGMAAGYGLRAFGYPDGYATAIGVARVAGLVALAIVLCGLWWRARTADPRRVVLLTGAALAATVLLGPVLYPWYALTPLGVLAASTVDTSVRRALAYATVGLSVLVLPFGLGVAVLTKFPGALLDVLAVVALAWWWFRRRRRAAPTTPTATT